MILITKSLEKRFAEIGEQINNSNPTIVCKLFTPRTNRTRRISEFYPDSKVFYGFVVGNCYPERGYGALEELEAIQGPYGLKIERDVIFQETDFNSLGL